MSLPVIEKIAQNIYDTLKGIRVSNGYHYDLTIERAKSRGNIPAHLKAIIYQLDPEEVEDEIHNKEGWHQPFAVDVFVLASESDETPVDRYCNVVWADIAKALQQDSTRGGNAIDTMIRSPLRFADINGELEGFTFRFDVKYRTAFTDPYQLAT